MSRASATGRLSSLLDAGVRRAVGSVQAAAFWAAVLFPLVYLTGFLAAAVMPARGLLGKPVLAALVVGNVLAVVVGQRYQPAD
jgi:hypothetical protein